MIEGFKCYAPDLAFENPDFRSEDFEILNNTESKNFWFVSRNKIVSSIVKKYFSGREDRKNRFLEIGCGTGYILKGLSAFSFLQLEGAEIHIAGLKYARERLPHINFIQLDATRMPFTNTYDAIGAFDVLEHIEEDEKVIANVYSALCENSYFFLSVPQYRWMWSITDEQACHKRRYTRKELLNKLTRHGFKIEYVTSFVFFLFPFMMLSRFMPRKQASHIGLQECATELKINPFLNSLFSFFMKIDEILISWGVSLPFGGSIIVVAKKEGQPKL